MGPGPKPLSEERPHSHFVQWRGREVPDGLASSGAIEIARVLGSISGGDVLDVGTGRGDLIDTLSEFLGSYTSFTGIDLDEGKLEKARERLDGKPVRFIRMDGGDMSFEDGTFDTVSISHSLHHLERVEAVMAEMLRVLRPGGTFILQEMFSDGEQTRAQRTDTAVHHWSRRIDELLGEYHRQTFTRDEIRSAVTALGLGEVRFLETTHGVSCLTCDDRFKCEHPLDQENIDRRVEDIEGDLDRLEDLNDPSTVSALEEEGRALIERVRKTGASNASTLFVIGRK
jgi:SAM-dependent methyltransferase